MKPNEARRAAHTKFERAAQYVDIGHLDEAKAAAGDGIEVIESAEPEESG